MKNKTKVIALLLALSMIVMMFAACSKEASKQEPDNKPTESTKTTEPDKNLEASEQDTPVLTLWDHTPQFEPAIKAVITEFNKEYPDITIEYEVKTDDQYYNLLATAIQAGETPDLFWCHGKATSNYESYVEQGILMDITDKVDLSAFADKMFDLITVDEKIYITPTAELGGRAVYYNKDIFNELGLTPPTKFSEFEALLPKIKDGGYVPISFAGSDSWTVLFQFEPILSALANDWIMEAQEGKADINDPRVVAVYEKMIDWADKGYYGPGFTGVDGAGAILAFSKGEAAMTIDGTWNLQTIQQNNENLNLGAFQLPSEDGVKAFVGTSSVGFGLKADTKYPEAGLKFLNFFASAKGQTAWLNTLSAIPGIPEVVAENPVINEIADFDIMTESFYTILGIRAKEGENPRKVWEEDQTKVLSGGLTAEEFLETLASMCD